MKLRHPISNAIYTLRDDGTVLVESADGREGVFQSNGAWKRGELRDADPRLRELGFTILAVSADAPEKLRAARETKGLEYTLLSDASQAAARAFGLAWQLDDAVVDRLRGVGIDVEAASGHDHHQLPVPAVFLVDSNRVIRFRSFDPDYKVRLPTELLLAEARALVKPAAANGGALP